MVIANVFEQGELDRMKAAIKDLVVTVEAGLLGATPMATTDHPERQFLPEKISVRYWPTPEGWSVWSVWIEGHAMLVSGELGKSMRCAFYSQRGIIDTPPDWVRNFVVAHIPGAATSLHCAR